MTELNLILILLGLGTVINFVFLVRIDYKLNVMIDKLVVSLEELNADQKKSTEYLKCIAKHHGYH